MSHLTVNDFHKKYNSLFSTAKPLFFRISATVTTVAIAVIDIVRVPYLRYTLCTPGISLKTFFLIFILFKFISLHNVTGSRFPYAISDTVYSYVQTIKEIAS